MRATITAAILTFALTSSALADDIIAGGPLHHPRQSILKCAFFNASNNTSVLIKNVRILNEGGVQVAPSRVSWTCSNGPGDSKILGPGESCWFAANLPPPTLVWPCRARVAPDKKVVGGFFYWRDSTEAVLTSTELR